MLEIYHWEDEAISILIDARNICINQGLERAANAIQTVIDVNLLERRLNDGVPLDVE